MVGFLVGGAAEYNALQHSSVSIRDVELVDEQAKPIVALFYVAAYGPSFSSTTEPQARVPVAINIESVRVTMLTAPDGGDDHRAAFQVRLLQGVRGTLEMTNCTVTVHQPLAASATGRQISDENNLR